MRLLVKSLAGGNFHIDVEPSDSVGSVKQKIQASQGHPAENQKLIYSGKILADEKNMGEYEIKEKDFLVVMVSKPKAKKVESDKPVSADSSAQAAPAPASAAATGESALSATPSKPKAESPATPAASTPAEAAGASSSNLPSTPAPSNGPTNASGSTGSLQTGSFLSGAELETAVSSIIEMGFSKEDVQRAMRMSFNNPDRAVEYLMNGLPEETAAAPSRTTGVPATPATPSPAPATSMQETPTGAGAGRAPNAGQSGNLFEQAAAMQSGTNRASEGLLGEEDAQGRQILDLGNPQVLSQLRTLLEQNPAALQPLVQALVQSNPQLAEAMSADPEGVLRMLAGEGLEGEDSFEVPSLQQLADEDRTQVEQIVAMGIPERKAIESYFMCGRNLEMAVQYYFEVRLMS